MESYKDYSSIYHLVFLGNLIINNKTALDDLVKSNLNEINANSDKTLYFSIFSQTLIFTHSFIDEYDNYFISKDSVINQKILQAKKIVKPAIDRIRKWDEMNTIRNRVLAHNFRNKDKSSIFTASNYHNYNAPSSLFDLQLLFECINLVTKFISENFEEEHNEYKKKITQVNQTQTVIVNEDQLNVEVQRIHKEIKENLNQ